MGRLPDNLDHARLAAADEDGLVVDNGRFFLIGRRVGAVKGRPVAHNQFQAKRGHHHRGLRVGRAGAVGQFGRNLRRHQQKASDDRPIIGHPGAIQGQRVQHPVGRVAEGEAMFLVGVNFPAGRVQAGFHRAWRYGFHDVVNKPTAVFPDEVDLYHLNRLRPEAQTNNGRIFYVTRIHSKGGGNVLRQ